MDNAAVASIERTLDGDGDDGLWPEHVEVWNAFMVATTQIRMAATVSRLIMLGFDYAGVRAGLECAGIAITPTLFADLRVMEIAACAALNGDP